MWPFTSKFPAVHAKDVGGLSDPTFDFIVVGGGSAGCCLASRLSEDPNVTVLLLERGPVADDWPAHVPLLSASPYRVGAPLVKLPSLPMPEVDGRVNTSFIGEGLGGGSLVNAMLYTRGISDYNQWKENGRKNWGYNDLVPYFIKSENTLSQPVSNFRGKKGTWINQSFPKPVFGISPRFDDAATSLGIPYSSDFNSPDSPATCCALMDVAIDSKMHRNSTFTAFLSPEIVRTRQNLTICVEAVVNGIKCATVEGSTKPRALGVYFGDAKDSSHTFYAHATREVVLCAGAVASPQILMLSGIGPKAHLASHGIPLIKDLPGVGSYLKDHLGIPVMFKVPLKDSLNIMRASIFRAILEILKYLIFGTSLLAVPFVQTSIFVRSALLNEAMEIPSVTPAELDARDPKNAPDIEIMPIPARASQDPEGPIDRLGVFSMLAAVVRPKSFGTIRLASPDPRTRAEINLGYLTNPDDLPIARKAVRLSLRLAKQMRARGYPLVDLAVPQGADDASVDAFIRKGIHTTYHYTSTCRMAPEDDAQPGVVDDELKIHGVDGLRVADCSSFPDIVCVHPMAPAVVVAEKCADFLKKW
ncbi:alcohol oxidase [Mycena alexandri]|uniref:Alcohol oxidase n=1 Tax=Mycena alexandri TaxID=1745969 RepID=A0AAD6S603_9AGAR|nr:alcohol oxidase [Mycena alexandri]